jgi:hypothetical protein
MLVIELSQQGVERGREKCHLQKHVVTHRAKTEGGKPFRNKQRHLSGAMQCLKIDREVWGRIVMYKLKRMRECEKEKTLAIKRTKTPHVIVEKQVEGFHSRKLGVKVFLHRLNT